MKEKMSEECNKPDYESVDSEYLYRLKENCSNFETTIEEIISIVEKSESSDQKLKDIKEVIDDLQEVIYYI